MNEPASKSQPMPPQKRRTALWLLIALCLGALAGYIPAALKSNQRKLELDQANRSRQVAAIHLDLSAAALDARRAKYELAREELSRFFTAFQGETDRTTDGSLGDQQQIQQIMKQRDDLITLLARNDPGSADRLSNLEMELRQSMHLK